MYTRKHVEKIDRIRRSYGKEYDVYNVSSNIVIFTSIQFLR